MTAPPLCSICGRPYFGKFTDIGWRSGACHGGCSIYGHTADCACPDRTDGAIPNAAVGVYASDPDAFTEAWYQRRAAAYANDARKIVEMVREYEEVHPHDAPCLESLLRATPGIAWRGHVQSLTAVSEGSRHG